MRCILYRCYVCTNMYTLYCGALLGPYHFGTLLAALLLPKNEFDRPPRALSHD